MLAYLPTARPVRDGISSRVVLGDDPVPAKTNTPSLPSNGYWPAEAGTVSTVGPSY